MPVYSKRYIQIEAEAHISTQGQSKAQIRALIFDKTSTFVLAEYSNYSKVFLAEYVVELLEHNGMNDHAIKLKKGKQSLFSPIQNLEPVKLETLMTYIKINLANGFIQSFKTFVGAPILFNQKPDRSLQFFIDYQSLKNITIKN